MHTIDVRFENGSKIEDLNYNGHIICFATEKDAIAMAIWLNSNGPHWYRARSSKHDNLLHHLTPAMNNTN